MDMAIDSSPHPGPLPEGEGVLMNHTPSRGVSPRFRADMARLRP
jgi:hypothetical protein